MTDRNRFSSNCLLALLLILMISGCGKDFKSMESLDGLKPEITSIVPKLKNIDLYGIELFFTSEVKNPYPFSISNAHFDYTLEVMGKKFLSGQNEVKTTIRASKTGKFSFPVRIEFLKVANILQDFEDAKEASYLLKGVLKFPAMNKTIEVPVQKEGNFPIFHMPEFHNVKVDSTDPSLFNIGIIIKADLKNTNAFPLGINGLRYAISLGDMTLGELKVHTDRTIEAGRLGKVTIEGKISAAGTIINLMNGKEAGAPNIEASGIIQTPYGKIRIKPPQPEKEKEEKVEEENTSPVY